MANNRFERALTYLLKPQENRQLLKILSEIHIGIEGPNRKSNIKKLCKEGGLKSVIKSLQQPHLDILDITLNILGTCCMEPACARDAVRRYNLLSYLNRILLEHCNHDSIQGRIFRIIGNMCQYCNELANIVVVNESELDIVAKIVKFLYAVAQDEASATVAQADDQASDIKRKASDATICMAIRALQDLTNSSTIVRLITDCGVLKAVGMILIKFAPEWQSNKQHGEILQAVLKLLHIYSEHNMNHTVIFELRNTDNGNAMVPLGKLVLLYPITVVKIIVNLRKVCKLTSDLPVGDITQALVDQLQNPAYFPCGRTDPMHRDYLKSICLLIQQPALKAEIVAADVIPTLLLILEDYTEFTDIAMKNTILIIATFRNMFEDPSLIIMLKHGIINILSEKLNWVLGPNAVVDVSHKYKSARYSYGSPKRIKMEMEIGTVFPCTKEDFSEGFENSEPTLSELHRLYQGIPSSSRDDILFPDCTSPVSSPTLSLGSAEDFQPAFVGQWGKPMYAADEPSIDRISSAQVPLLLDPITEHNDYSSFCSDATDESSIPLTTIKEGDDEMDAQPSYPNLYSKKLLSNEIVKLVKLFTNIRPVAMELGNGDLLTKLLMLLLPANILICPSDTAKIIQRIVSTSEYLIGLMQTDFISATYKFTVKQHKFGCTTCRRLHETGKSILMPFCNYVEGASRPLGIRYLILKVPSPEKDLERVVTAIPFCTLTKSTLLQLMSDCGGLDCLLRLFREQLNLQPTSIYNALCLTALKLGMESPSMNTEKKVEQTRQLRIDIETYELIPNCAKIVSFKLDDGSCVQADRDFLSQKSEYFNRLLSGEFKESHEEEIQLGNVLNKSLKCLLMLLQYDVRRTELLQIDIELELLLDVISLTDRYVMDDLCFCLTLSVQYFKFSPATIPIIYQWALESGTNILRVESVAYALVAKISEAERLSMFKILLRLGYSDQLANDIEKLLRRLLMPHSLKDFHSNEN